jgi:hypothetical protein
LHPPDPYGRLSANCINATVLCCQSVLGLLKSVLTVTKAASGPSPSALNPNISQIILDKHLVVRSNEAPRALATWCFGISERLSHDNPSKQS